MIKKVFSLTAAVLLTFSTLSMTSHTKEQVFNDGTILIQQDECIDAGIVLIQTLDEEGVDENISTCVGIFFIEACQGGDPVALTADFVDCVQS